MLLKKLTAVLLAVLIVALGCLALAGNSTAAGNDGVQQLKPGGDNGDPDSGGPGGRSVDKRATWFSATFRSITLSTVLRGWTLAKRVPEANRFQRSMTVRR